MSTTTTQVTSTQAHYYIMSTTTTQVTSTQAHHYIMSTTTTTQFTSSQAHYYIIGQMCSVSLSWSVAMLSDNETLQWKVNTDNRQHTRVAHVHWRRRWMTRCSTRGSTACWVSSLNGSTCPSHSFIVGVSSDSASPTFVVVVCVVVAESVVAVVGGAGLSAIWRWHLGQLLQRVITRGLTWARDGRRVCVWRLHITTTTTTLQLLQTHYYNCSFKVSSLQSITVSCIHV